MKIHTTEALMKAEISRRSLMKTSALGSLALEAVLSLCHFPKWFGRQRFR